MIPSSVFVALALMIIGGIVVFLIPAFWWIKTRREKLATVLVGAATWFLFAIVLESIPKTIFLNPASSLGQTIMNSAVLFTVIGAALAGIFEETGRFVAYKTILKNRTNKETGISHGIGHGGFEAFFILGLSGIQYIAYALMINSGKFQELIDMSLEQGMPESMLAQVTSIPDMLMGINPGYVVLPLLERVFAITLHVALSVLVFYAVRDRKIWMYGLAIILHTLFDVPAALYQFGVITNILVVEIIIAVYAIALFVIIYNVLYKNDRKTKLAEEA